MNIALWILQVLLALLFVWHGWLFISPPAELVEIMNAQFAPSFRIFLGVAEWLAAIGLVLPGITRIMPQLTALAAAGLMIVLGSASVLHASRGETSSAVTTAILFVIVTFVAYMRWKVKPIAPRSVATATNDREWQQITLVTGASWCNITLFFYVHDQQVHFEFSTGSL